MKKIVSGLFLSWLVTGAFAAAPVVDYSSNVDVNTAKSFAMKTDEPVVATPVVQKINLSQEQMLNRLEQQVNNINSQNLSGKIEELQQQVQKLTGQLEEKSHQIELLNTQLKGFYQDLNQRLEGNKQLTAPPTSQALIANQAVPTAIVVAPSPLPLPSLGVIGNAAVVQDAGIVPATANNLINVFSSGETKKNDDVKPVNTDSAILKEQQMYQTAIDLLPDKKHESENKLRDYLNAYPKGAHVANAHYWLGEINFLQKNFDAAEEEFKIVVDKYPKSKRVSDAALKLALVHQNQGRDAQTTKRELQQVIKRYPGTSAAQLAKQQLNGR